LRLPLALNQIDHPGQTGYSGEMTTFDAPLSFENAEEALLQLVVPEVSSNAVFYLGSTAYLGSPNSKAAITALSLVKNDFPSLEDFEAAQNSRMFWQWERKRDQPCQKAATTLELLLANEGHNTDVQRRAAEAFSRFFPTMTLAHNDYMEAGYNSVHDFAEGEHSLRIKKKWLGGRALFETNQEYDDLYLAEKTGLWTIIDNNADSLTVAAASTLKGALAKAWALAPCLEPYRRRHHMDQQLPKPFSSTARGPRF